MPASTWCISYVSAEQFCQKNALLCKITKSYGHMFSGPVLLSQSSPELDLHKSPRVWTGSGLKAVRRVEIILHTGAETCSHVMITPTHRNHENQYTMTRQLHNLADPIFPMHIGAFLERKKKPHLWVDVTGRQKKNQQGTEPQRQTCILHLTRSSGTTAVCVVPQLRIPPKPHRTKYF